LKLLDDASYDYDENTQRKLLLSSLTTPHRKGQFFISFWRLVCAIGLSKWLQFTVVTFAAPAHGTCIVAGPVLS
jgi:hypothetical protein